ASSYDAAAESPAPYARAGWTSPRAPTAGRWWTCSPGPRTCGPAHRSRTGSRTRSRSPDAASRSPSRTSPTSSARSCAWSSATDGSPAVRSAAALDCLALLALELLALVVDDVLACEHGAGQVDA